MGISIATTRGTSCPNTRGSADLSPNGSLRKMVRYSHGTAILGMSGRPTVRGTSEGMMIRFYSSTSSPLYPLPYNSLIIPLCVYSNRFKCRTSCWATSSTTSSWRRSSATRSSCSRSSSARRRRPNADAANGTSSTSSRTLRPERSWPRCAARGCGSTSR